MSKAVIKATCAVIFLALLFFGCGSPPGAPTSPPNPTVWMGSLAVKVTLIDNQNQRITPDSVWVVLNGDTLGLFPNPDTLTGIPEGTHTLRAYREYAGLTYQSVAHIFFVTWNTVTTVTVELTRSGVLIVSAVAGSVLPDSLLMKLDGDTLGWGANPYIASAVPMGEHKVVVSSVNSEQDWEGWKKGISVTAAETTRVNLAMDPVAPDSGWHAPDIAAMDLDGVNWSLSDHWGKVIFLYFFEHT